MTSETRTGQKENWEDITVIDVYSNVAATTPTIVGSANSLHDHPHMTHTVSIGGANRTQGQRRPRVQCMHRAVITVIPDVGGNAVIRCLPWA